MPDIIEHLEITALTHGGRGIGHHDGKAVFVPLTVPGDVVTCTVARAKKRYAEAELLEILRPSATRRAPPCPYFGRCGGCQWQQLSYPEQARWKQTIFADLLTRNGIAGPELIRSLVPAPDEWRYRNRTQFKCHQTGEGPVIGFYRQGSHFVIDIERCLLAAPAVQSTLELLRAELPSVPFPASLPQIDVDAGDDGQVRIVVHVLPAARSSLRPWLREFAVRHRLTACLQSGRKETLEVVHGESRLFVAVDRPQLLLGYGPGGFVQVNSAQNRNMIAWMSEILALHGNETVLDLFCGMGNFSLPLARRAGRVTAIEDHAASIESARSNALANDVGNIDFHVADASAVGTLFQSGNRLDLAVIDPPRTGNYRVSLELLKLRPERILYVSCDPATLVRDLTPLVHGGYRVVASRPFDLFPQTWHIESMTLLARDIAG